MIGNEVILECKGRLANQILCWANARYALASIGVNRPLVINYAIDQSRVSFPGADCRVVCDVDSLRRVTQEEITDCTEPCLWVWEDVYRELNVPGLQQILSTIKVHEGFASSIVNYAGNARCVGIHFRCGDYVKPELIEDENYPFIRGGSEYFLSAIDHCMRIDPSSVFFLSTDGDDDDVRCIYDRFSYMMDRLIVGRKEDSLFDMFCLSKCRFIIGSYSTFTEVAKHIGSVPAIRPDMDQSEAIQILSRLQIL